MTFLANNLQLLICFPHPQLNIHKFKFVSRFGLTHIVAVNLCVWIRTLVKECNKDIALYRSQLGHGVSEDFMVLGKQYNRLSMSNCPVYREY